MRTPIVSLVWRQARTIRELRRELDDLKHENAVLRTRCRRWQRTAQELAPQVNERAVAAVGLMSDSDTIADLPEIDERRRSDGLA